MAPTPAPPTGRMLIFTGVRETVAPLSLSLSLSLSPQCVYSKLATVLFENDRGLLGQMNPLRCPGGGPEALLPLFFFFPFH